MTPTEIIHYTFEGQKILLVEDVASNREIIKGFLEPMNLEISIAENGQDALDALKTNLPDLILMDMMMPIMDGYTAVKIIRGKNNYDGIPIIALTASALKQSEREIREFCNDYLRKPVSKKDLVNVLSKYLAHTTSSDKNNRGDKRPRKSPFVLPEQIKESLKANFLPGWKEVSRLMSIDDIVVFTRKLQAYAVEGKNKDLTLYCTHLLEFADNFEIEKMNTAFLQFETLVQNEVGVN